jgi:hypothetical protein
MKRLLVRAVVPDRDWARAIIAALAAEGIAATLALSDTISTSSTPVIFVCSKASLRARDYARQLERDALKPWAVVVALEDLSQSSLGEVVHGVACADLQGWNKQNRSFAGFRDLVLACRRLCDHLDVPPLLRVPELLRQRRRAKVRTSPPHTRSRQKGADAAAIEPLDHLGSSHKEIFHTDMDGPASQDESNDITLAHQLAKDLASEQRPARSDAAASEIATRATSRGRTDQTIDASVFAPSNLQPGEHAVVQVFLHCPEDKTAVELSEETDDSTRRRGITTLTAAIAYGQQVDVTLQAPGLKIDRALQQLVWRGIARSCQFVLKVPKKAQRSYHINIRLAVEQIPVGTLSFSLNVSQREPTGMLGLRGDGKKPYRYAFLSYASPDRLAVLQRAQLLRALGIAFFQDLLSIEPGAEWEPRLFAEIDRCDVFLLFWSSNAARSKWVTREIKHALGRQKSSPDRVPEIAPILIEGPPVPPPPRTLKHLHFNDPLLFVTATIANQGKRKAGRSGRRAGGGRARA